MILTSIGTIGLIKAVSSYSDSKGTRLATYAARCIENEILMVLRAEKKLQNEVSLFEAIKCGNSDGEMTFLEILENNSESIFEEVELKSEIKKLREIMDSVLSERELLIIKLRYGLCGKSEKTQREIADILNISRSYVSRIEKRAINKLNKRFVV